MRHKLLFFIIYRTSVFCGICAYNIDILKLSKAVSQRARI